MTDILTSIFVLEFMPFVMQMRCYLLKCAYICIFIFLKIKPSDNVRMKVFISLRTQIREKGSVAIKDGFQVVLYCKIYHRSGSLKLIFFFLICDSGLVWTELSFHNSFKILLRKDYRFIIDYSLL